MNVTRAAISAAFLWGSVLLSFACADSTGPDSGLIDVTVSTTGGSIDPDGYTLSLDDGTPQPVSVNGSMSFPNLSAGTHTVRLENVEPNCGVRGSATLSVTVAAKRNPAPIVIGFSVFCTAKPGNIHISAVTSGADPDPDGYFVRVFNQIGSTDTPPQTYRLLTNGSLDISGVKSGNYGISLFGVAENCVVDGSQNRTASVGPGGDVNVSFIIRCVQSGGLLVTTTTTGVQTDTDGYYVALQLQGSTFATGAEANSNGSLKFPHLLPGTYLLTVHAISANCDATLPNPRLISVVAGSISPISVDVKCETPRTLAFVSGDGPRVADIFLVNSNKTGVAQLTTHPATDTDPAWSPDGKKIAFTSQRDGNSEIYLMNADGTNQTRLTVGPATDNRPAWSPAGGKIAFVSDRDGNREIYVMNSDGTNATRLTTEVGSDGDPDWSPDGSKIAFTSDRGGVSGIFVMNADGTGARRLTSNSRPERQPAWSPDGTKIAFSRAVSANTRDIYIMQFDGTGVTPLTRGFEDAADPSWSPDGSKIAVGEISYYYGSQFYIFSLTGVPYGDVSPLTVVSNPTWRP